MAKYTLEGLDNAFGLIDESVAIPGGLVGAWFVEHENLTAIYIEDIFGRRFYKYYDGKWNEWHPLAPFSMEMYISTHGTSLI